MSKLLDDAAPFTVDVLYPRYAQMADPLEWRLKQYLKPAAHTPLDVRWWLRSVIKEWNIKPTSLAKEAKIAPSTLNRFIESDDHTKNLNASTIEKLSNALKAEMDRRKDDVIAEEFPAGENLVGDRQIAQAIILGPACTAEWSEPEEFDPNKDYNPEDDPHWYINVPVVRPYFQMVLAGFDVAGSELEPVFAVGDLLVCAPVSKLDRPPPYGSFVIVHEVAESGLFRNSVMNTVTDPAGHQWLMPVGAGQPSAAPVYANRISPGWPQTKVTFLVVARVSNV